MSTHNKFFFWRNLRRTAPTKSLWIEEAIDFEKDMSKWGIAHTQAFLGTSISQKKINTFFILLCTGIIILGIKIFYLQIIKGNHYHTLAENNRIRLLPIAAERGIIYDRNHKPLVENVPSFSLNIVPQDLPHTPTEKKLIIKKASEISGVPEETILKKVERFKGYGYLSLVIKENIDYDSALKLYTTAANLPGIVVESGTKRHYLNDYTYSSSTLLSMSHILGYLGKLEESEVETMRNKNYLPSDDIGKTGLEKIYEPFLRGVYGRKKIEVNALGQEKNVLAIEPPQPGHNLTLSLDIEAQSTLETLLKNQLATIHAKRGSAIALNPQTGEVLALVSLPAFDDNNFSGGITSNTYRDYLENKDRPLFNRAIAGSFPPGSTAKMIIATAALEEHIVSPETTINSVGGIQVGGTFFRDWKEGGHGTTNVYKALAESVNTFFYYVGGGYRDFKGLGIDKITQYLNRFHSGQKTGIDLTGEGEGLVPTPQWKKEVRGEPWYIGDTYNTSIGQGNLLVTPLQVAVWTAAIVNGGKIISPHLEHDLTDTFTKKITTYQPVVLKKDIASLATLQHVKNGMRQCVVSGSCFTLRNLPFTAGAKTGTAQWSNNHPTHAWFTGFAPYENPHVVITVLIEEGGEGSVAAGPVARDFLKWWSKKNLTAE